MPADARIAAIARTLVTDEVMADVVAELRAAEVEPVLLKGPSLALWLYRGEAPRLYTDIDLLVEPAHHQEAERVLTGLGFDPIEPYDYGGEYEQHGRAWGRSADAMIVDLHRTLPGLRAITPADAWPVLRSHRTTLRVAGMDVPVLDHAARLVLVCLHVVHHEIERAETGKALRDLELAVRVATEDEWRAALELSARLEARLWFTAGLRHDPAGNALADRIGAPGKTVMQAMEGNPGTSLVEGFERVARADGVRERARIMVRELLPPPAFMRYSSSLARTGRLGLVRAYVARIARLLRLSRPSYRAWRRGPS